MIDRNKYYKHPKECKFCGKIISYKNRINIFCNHSCSASFNNKITPHTRNFVYGNYSKKECIVCGKISKNIKYCSIKCQKMFEWNRRKEFFEKNGFFEGSNNDSSIRVLCKRYILEKRGHKCEVCGGTEWMGQKIPLILDHIDGHSENNDLNNLRLVCGNCDMQLPTYKSKNKGNGRAYRRKRYAEGKTY